ncbi:MAG: ArsR family transcriptional regulator [Thermoproteota archaeon]|jgi:predicted transcriptional regulator
MSSEDLSQHNKYIEGIKIVTSNELRLSIVKLLNEKGPLNIGSLSSNLNRSRQLIKHHVSILEKNEIITQKNYGSLKVYELTEFGKRMLAKIQDKGLEKENEKKTRLRKLYRIGITLIISLIPLILAIVRFILDKTHTFWILGGIIASLTIYYVLNKVWKERQLAI